MKAAFVIFAVLAVIALKVNADLTVACTENQDGEILPFHPHPCYCNTYYACMGTEPLPMPCPRGLHWNRNLNMCDWPNKAKCRPEPDC